MTLIGSEQTTSSLVVMIKTIETVHNNMQLLFKVCSQKLALSP